jgi:phage terminase large subunit-like protein
VTALSLADFEQFASRCVLDNGEPMRLEPFQREMVADFCDPSIRETWCVLPEASGKSTLLGVFALYVLMRTPGANVVLASVTQQQAGSAMYKQASDVISRTPGLSRHLRAIDGRLRIYGPAKARLEVKPSTPSTAQGSIPDLVVVDELGELASMELARMLRGKLTKRAGASMIVISSAGEPGSEFELTLEKIRNEAQQVERDGRHARYQSGPTVVHEWRLLEGDELTDWSLLKAANPLSSVSEESLREKWESPLTDRSHFSRYTGGRAEYSEDHVISREVWDAAEADFEALDAEELHRTILGLDFAQSYDDLAIVPAILYRSGAILLGPATLLEPARPGEPIPLERMQDAVRRLADAHGDVYEVWINPAAGSSPLEEWISAQIAPVVVYGMTQAEALDLTETFLAALHGGKLRHSGDEGLRSHALNATARYTWDGDRFMFARPKESRRAKAQGTRRIDALSAASLAVKGCEAQWLPFTAEELARLKGQG